MSINLFEPNTAYNSTFCQKCAEKDAEIESLNERVDALTKGFDSLQQIIIASHKDREDLRTKLDKAREALEWYRKETRSKVALLDYGSVSDKALKEIGDKK